MMRILAILLLCFVVVNLFVALYHLLREKSGSAKTVRALTVRVVLSVVLFLLIIVSAHFGWSPK